MFKTIITAAAFSVAAASAHAALPTEAYAGASLRNEATAPINQGEATFDTAYYCEWVTVYDYWGNWVTYWECY